MKFSNPYWDNKTKIELLQRWILTHSIIYYELDCSLISDAMFDGNMKQLVQLIEADSGAFRRSKGYRAFRDFDGSTGFDLFTKLRKNEKVILKQQAEALVKQFGGAK